jgi:hypothetical protein
MPSLTGGAITPLASDQHGEGRQLGESGPVLIEFPFCLLGPLPFQGRGARPIS